jgi:DNA-binding response OmpR family regulator
MVRASIIRHVRDRFEVREEADGEAGWQTLMVDPTIQAVITDIGMPHLDGYGLLERIRSAAFRINTLPVVVISGDDEPDVRVKAKSAGATDFISKSIGNVELLARLEALTQLARPSGSGGKPGCPRHGQPDRSCIRAGHSVLSPLSRRPGAVPGPSAPWGSLGDGHRDRPVR